MMNEDKKIRFVHVKLRRGTYALACFNAWIRSHNFGIKPGLKQGGYSVKELRAACPKPNEDLEELIKFIDDNNLWDIPDDYVMSENEQVNLKNRCTTT
jgi:hypothetical protein